MIDQLSSVHSSIFFLSPICLAFLVVMTESNTSLREFFNTKNGQILGFNLGAYFYKNKSLKIL